MAKKPGGRGRTADSSVREKAYLHIQRKIASRELQAGSAVSELALSKELGSSRSPIREALGQLAAEGLLEQTPNRGAVVVQLKRQDIVELYELREALEVYAAGKAARLRTRGPDLERLRGLCAEIGGLKEELEKSGKPFLAPRQMQHFMNSDLGYHTLLMRMAANSRILKVVNETRLLIRIFAMRHSGHSLEELDRIHCQHCDILAAVTAGDAERAMALVSHHIITSGAERLEEFDTWERETSLRNSVPGVFNMPPPAG